MKVGLMWDWAQKKIDTCYYVYTSQMNLNYYTHELS